MLTRASIIMDMNKLSIERRTQIIACLVEGNSVRATCRLTHSSKDAVLKLVADAGEACLEYQSENFRNLSCKRIQCDEIWSFVYAKAKNVPAEYQGQFGKGDVWTWTAIDADTKLVPCWLVGTRGPQAAMTFMRDLASRLTSRVQLSTDGYHCYLNAVDSAFAGDIDYAQIVKMYSTDPMAETRYSPSICWSAERRIIRGNPDRDHISTSFVERQNLNMRMGMRRFTRLTNAFSKKVENHAHAVALFYMYYNFARIHQTLKTETPAMASGVSDHVWSIEEIAAIIP
jgi:IS1 family transposase